MTYFNIRKIQLLLKHHVNIVDAYENIGYKCISSSFSKTTNPKAVSRSMSLMKLRLLLRFVVLTHSSSPSKQPSKHSSLHVRTNNEMQHVGPRKSERKKPK